MSNATHTPGPWACTEGDEYSTHEWNVMGAWRGNCRVMVGEIQREADARLIAAAPELLEALTSFLAEFGDKAVNANVRAARAAIAKATGEKA